MADEPIEELGGKTPLEVAATPHMDALATKGETGLVQTIPDGYPPGSDVANLSALGYDPKLYYTGRSPLEAVSMGVDLAEEDVAFRCNLVTVSDEVSYADKTMLDYSGGEISTDEARELLAEIEKRLGNPNLRFYPGISYRHLLVWGDGPEQIQLTPPHDISLRPVAGHLPQGDNAGVLLELMEKSFKILDNHPVNAFRAGNNQPKANSLWFWGQGKKPALPSFQEKYHLTGSVISAVDLIKGIGMCAGLEVVEVEGATGNIHTNFRGKTDAALKELERGQDFIFIHVEAPDEAGHQGDLAIKIKAIEEVDKMLGRLLEGLKRYPAYRVMVLPDHPTPLSIRTHTDKPVPFIKHSNNNPFASTVNCYSEAAATASGIFYPSGEMLMNSFINA
jgi:2,3-bisphosphoglycerate-independent phosphoglycerate mutase